MSQLSSLLVLCVGFVAVGCSSRADGGAGADVEQSDETRDVGQSDDTRDVERVDASSVSLRVATFNVSMFRDAEGDLVDDLGGGGDSQAKKVAEILQRVRPDIVLLNEFDRDDAGEAARLFEESYLSVDQGGASALSYPHRYVPETNTGVHSGVDLNGDGRTVSTPGEEGYGDDAFGFGAFPGQYGMVIYSRFPIAVDDVRTFRKFHWSEVPDALLPTDWYSEVAVEMLRLSSKNHVDLPVDVDGRRLHVLASHPTPPAFDGPEDRNGRRNHDEIRFWSDYITGGETASYIRNDSGRKGGLGAGRSFVVVGDLNVDPHDGDGRGGAIRDLLEHPRTTDPRPGSDGAAEASRSDGRVNTSHEGDSRLDTADFSDDEVGNLRVDYVLPSTDLDVEDAGVFWPSSDSERAGLRSASDHHLVWVDVTIDAS